MKEENIKFDFSAPMELALRREKPITINKKYRTCFMRDRDRILYSIAFRRLSRKTQIYVTEEEDDHRRNRLTHTLEVAQIARTISQALGLDCDLTEAIALGHDLGHTPFGHAGEQILHEIMVPGSPIKNSPLNSTDLNLSLKKNSLGFKHNIQSVRVVASLETNYEKDGLNLTNFTLWGILHHSSLIYKKNTVKTSHLNPTYKNNYQSHLKLLDSSSNSSSKEAWSFEAFVVAQADEIAQWHHDLEDALRGGAMTPKEVCEEILINLNDILPPEEKERLETLKKNIHVDKKLISDLARIVINTLVDKLIECSIDNLNKLWEKEIFSSDSEEIKRNKLNFFTLCDGDEEGIKDAISFKEVDGTRTFSFKRTISEKVHHSQKVERMNVKGKYIIKKLFESY